MVIFKLRAGQDLHCVAQLDERDRIRFAGKLCYTICLLTMPAIGSADIPVRISGALIAGTCQGGLGKSLQWALQNS